MDKHSKEQQFHKSDAIKSFCIYKRSGAIHIMQPGLVTDCKAGRQLIREF